MFDDNSSRSGAFTENRALLVGLALAGLAVLSKAAAPVAAIVVLYGP